MKPEGRSQRTVSNNDGVSFTVNSSERGSEEAASRPVSASAMPCSAVERGVEDVSIFTSQMRSDPGKMSMANASVPLPPQPNPRSDGMDCNSADGGRNEDHGDGDGDDDDDDDDDEFFDDDEDDVVIGTPQE